MEKDQVISFAMLSRFVRAVWRHLWLIAAIVLLAVAGAALLDHVAIQPFVADSWLLVKTPPLTQQQQQYVNNYPGDLDAMASLLDSIAVESRVLANPQSAALPADIRQPGALVQNIDIQADTRADQSAHIFHVVAKGATAADATLLANLWSEESVAFLNQYFLADTSGLQKLQAQAKASYQQAEQAYQTFLSSNSADEMEGQVSALTQSINLYLDAAGSSEVAVYREQLQANQRNLAEQYALLEKLRLSLDNAQALKTAIGGSPTARLEDSVALASLLTTASSIVPTGTLPVQIQIGTTGATPPTRDEQLQDLDTLVAVLQNRIAGVQTTITTTSQAITTMQPYSVTASLPPPITALIQREHDLNKQLESVQAQENQLKGERDLYWQSYTDLSKRLIDVTQGLSSLNQVDQVVRADERLAVRPTVTSRTLINTLFISLAVMLLVVLLYELVAPGRQIAREVLRLRPGRHPAPSPR